MDTDYSAIFDTYHLAYDGQVIVSGIDDSITILRDQMAIPHIMAQTVNDAFFGQGFVHAQDRLWQMESDRLRAYGTLSAVLGKHTLNQDVFWRRLGLERNAKDDFQRCSLPVQQMFQSYARGVNAYLSSNKLSPELVLLNHRPAPWNPWDAIAVFKSRHLSMGRWEHKLWRLQLAQKFGVEAMATLHPVSSHFHALSQNNRSLLDDLSAMIQGMPQSMAALSDRDEGGSNNWVISGRHTVSGKPLLAGDPHRAIEIPNVYYQNHLISAEINVIGFSFPGTPGFPHFGHNEYVAWSITHTAADTQDVFVEEFDKRRVHVRQGTTWAPIENRTEIIQVRNQEPVSIQSMATSNGPIITWNENYGLALKLAALQQPNRTWESLYHMLYAKTAEQLDQSMRDWVDPVNNLLYADIHGHIGYRMRGKLPVRALANAWLPVASKDLEHAWSGFVPFEAMPHITDPPAGCIVTANNQVYEDTFPYYVTLDFAADHRAARIREVILRHPKWDVDDMRHIHGDIHSKSAEKFLHTLAMAEPNTSDGRRWQEILGTWDGDLSLDTVYPTIYNTVRKILVKKIMTACTNEAWFQQTRTWPAVMWQFSRLTSHLVNILADKTHPITLLLGKRCGEPWGYALDEVAQQYNPRSQPGPLWQEVHQIRSLHPLSKQIAFPKEANVSDHPMGGDGDTIQAASYSLLDFTVKGTSVARYAFDLGDWNRSGWITPFGTSGIPVHTHYTDQFPQWYQHHLYPMHFTVDQVIRHAKYSMTLSFTVD
ncbi:MAG: hypothetical protein C7B46_17965 [Sulfobacillus benefaciens]|uniref:Penicillin acylase family protein n=1 Tax=Sulfobacillus benefaciens TaxID=453960 RepID=A0A2T2X7C1_9FIRM|nr:MAG: hypothetical protein C7B46_17965 [Sulfobacillus benefaciens]